MAKIINKTIIISSHDEGTFEFEKTTDKRASYR